MSMAWLVGMVTWSHRLSLPLLLILAIVTITITNIDFKIFDTKFSTIDNTTYGYGELISPNFIYYQGLFFFLNSKACYIGMTINEDILALKEVGIIDSIRIFRNSSPPLIIQGEGRWQPFNTNIFNFEFFNKINLE